MENYHLSIHMAFWKESMINRLSNLINRNRSAAKISQVLCSNTHPQQIPSHPKTSIFMVLIALFMSVCQFLKERQHVSSGLKSVAQRPDFESALSVEE